MHPAGTAPSPAGSYIDWGVIHISVSNTVIILVMILVFVLAVVLPFPGSDDEQVPSLPAREGGDRP